eukprot:764199-Hanusia_phi.AAC.2
MDGRLHAAAAGDLLDSLSFSRTRKFSGRVEDELENLLRAFMRSRGAQRRVVFPPLSQPLRETLSSLADRYGMKVMVMPEGDLEKPTSVEVCQTSRFPCLKLEDLAPQHCALQFTHRPNPDDDSGSKSVSASSEAESAAEASEDQSNSSPALECNEAKESAGRRNKPAMAIYRPRQARSSGAEGSQGDEHVDRHKKGQGVERSPEPSENLSEEDKLLKKTVSETSSSQDATSQEPDCSLLYDYQSYRLDLNSSRAWEDQVMTCLSWNSLLMPGAAEEEGVFGA